MKFTCYTNLQVTVYIFFLCHAEQHKMNVKKKSVANLIKKCSYTFLDYKFSLKTVIFKMFYFNVPPKYVDSFFLMSFSVDIIYYKTERQPIRYCCKYAL